MTAVRTRSPTPNRSAARPLSPLLAIAVLSSLSNNAVRLAVPYRAFDLGAGPVEIGFIASGFAALSLVVTLPIGRYVDRFGPRFFIAGGMALASLTCLMLAWADSLLMLGLGYAIFGLAQTINLVAAQTEVGNRGGRRGRDERFGNYAAAVSIGQLVGPSLAGTIAAGGLDDLLGPIPELMDRLAIIFVLALACSAGAALIGLWQGTKGIRATEPKPDGPHISGKMVGTARRIMSREGVPRAILVGVIVVSAHDVIATFLPVFGQATGLSVGFVGLLLSVRAGSGLVSRTVMGRLLRRLGRRRLLALGMASAGACLLVLPLAPTEVLMVGLMAVIGFGLGLGQPITIAWVASQTPRSERATALALRLTGNRAALLTVPVAMGLIAGFLGVGASFALMAGLILAGSGAALTSSLVDDPQRDSAAADQTESPA